MTKAIGVASDYSGLVDLLRARKESLGYTCETLDEVAGLPSGYVGKLLGPGMVKKLGHLSLGLMLDALGLRIVLVEDPRLAKKAVLRSQQKSGSRGQANAKSDRSFTQ
ncbi:MAG: hypothetical protein HY242_09105 [Afipia sp.]|nr:hypothetical protein [Afipia sp.]